MNHLIRKTLKPVASLTLTVVLLGAAMLVILAGTLAQMDAGIWQVQKRFFHAWFCWIDWGLFFPRAGHGQFRVPGRFPFVGGYFLITALLVNLLSAHLVRFKLNWKRSGIILIHLGLILLLTGEILTSLLASEGQMTLTAGQSLNYAQDIRACELAVTDASPADHENVTVVPALMLEKRGAIVRDARLPFEFQVADFYPNSQPLGPFQDGPKADPRVNAGAEVGRRIVPLPSVAGAGADADKVDLPSAILTLSHDGKSLGTWLVSLWARGPQTVTLDDGRSVQIELRFKRTYKPYTVQLLKFSHDRYVGTDLDKNFASRVHLVDPSRGVDREALIWMNHPLRYAGETFYQQSFGKDESGRDNGATTLQIVRNPSWLMPYAALGIAIVGLVIQFGGHLLTFLRRQLFPLQPLAAPAGGFPPRLPGSKAAGVTGPVAGPPPLSLARRYWPGAAVSVLALMVIVSFLPLGAIGNSSFDLAGFARIAINYEGRTMPIDTLARTSLKIIHGSESLSSNGKSIAPVQWLLDVTGRPEAAADYPAFRIDNPDVLSAIGLDTTRKYFSFAELLAQKEKLQPQLDRVFAAQGEQGSSSDDVFSKKLLELGQRLSLYVKIQELASLYVVPPLQSNQQWQSVAEAIKAMSATGTAPAGLRSFMTLIDAYHLNKPEEFNAGVVEYHGLLARSLPEQSKADYETFFNRFDPFGICQFFYVAIFMLAIGSWLGWRRGLSQAAVCLLTLTFLVHSFGLVSRIYISGRPPVTNLYSSAVFIAWGAVALSIGLELIFGNGVGSVVGAMIGFCSLLIAQALSVEGDTMHQLRAVLDTNFWLATHVVVITLGYASTFLAGLLAIVYIALGLTTRMLDDDAFRKQLARMVYGIVCFALLFSFVGTILGGIWADQSWGRFWGWDPKENGAVLIVLWNAIILHARWGGLVRERGVMVLAVFGNAVTSWSWFGTNMLGVGLHSYGFMDRAFPILLGFMVAQLVIMGFGSLPLPLWRSFRQTTRRPRPDVRFPAKQVSLPAPS